AADSMHGLPSCRREASVTLINILILADKSASDANHQIRRNATGQCLRWFMKVPKKESTELIYGGITSEMESKQPALPKPFGSTEPIMIDSLANRPSRAFRYDSIDSS
ncbi:MAG: hypothetical protein AAFO01_16540, partial [Pseudomonadota bacterium]